MPMLDAVCPFLGSGPSRPRRVRSPGAGALACSCSSGHMADASMAARRAGGTSGRAESAASSTAADASPSFEISEGFCAASHP